jgi:mRNA interferase MazF
LIRRGDIYWTDLGDQTGSEPAKRRPVLVVQADSFNASRINTALAAVITTNQRLAAAPGNVALPKNESRLPKDSVVNVSQVVTLDKLSLAEKVSSLSTEAMSEVGAGLRLVLDL